MTRVVVVIIVFVAAVGEFCPESRGFGRNRLMFMMQSRRSLSRFFFCFFFFFFSEEEGESLLLSYFFYFFFFPLLNFLEISSARTFARTAHSFAASAVLA